MNPHVRGMLARLLWNRRAELLRAVAETEEDLRRLGQERHHELEEWAQDATAARLLALVSEREHCELDEVEAAIHRLGNGTYGRCAVCARAIPIERLRTLPAARLCVDCERAEEHRASSTITPVTTTR